MLDRTRKVTIRVHKNSHVIFTFELQCDLVITMAKPIPCYYEECQRAWHQAN